MKKIFTPSILRQVRKYHSENTAPLGQRLAYLPPKTKANQKSKDVTAILFGTGMEKHDDLLSNIYRHLGLGTYVASLPYSAVFTYDQNLQKEFAKELVNVLDSESIKEKVFCHVHGCHGFAFYKHFTQEIRNHNRMQNLDIIGCTMDDTPTNIYRSSLPLFYPIPPLNLMIRYIQYISKAKGIDFAQKLDLTDDEKLKSVTVIPMPGDILSLSKSLTKNFWKYGPNEWSGNYMLKKENEKWPIQFNYFAYNSKFMDNLIDVKRKQSAVRHVEGNKFYHFEQEAFDVLAEDVRDFFWKCLEDKEQRLGTKSDENHAKVTTDGGTKVIRYPKPKC